MEVAWVSSPSMQTVKLKQQQDLDKPLCAHARADATLTMPGVCWTPYYP